MDLNTEKLPPGWKIIVHGNERPAVKEMTLPRYGKVAVEVFLDNAVIFFHPEEKGFMNMADYERERFNKDFDPYENEFPISEITAEGEVMSTLTSDSEEWLDIVRAMRWYKNV